MSEIQVASFMPASICREEVYVDMYEVPLQVTQCRQLSRSQKDYYSISTEDL